MKRKQEKQNTLPINKGTKWKNIVVQTTQNGKIKWKQQ